MVPESSYAIGEELTVTPVAELPSLTYGVNWETGTIAGQVDELAAMRQAIMKILRTERFDYLIYSWDYGTELRALDGLDRELAESEMRRVITEALLADSRITAVGEIEVTGVGTRAVTVSFTATTIYGETEVTANV